MTDLGLTRERVVELLQMAYTGGIYEADDDDGGDDDDPASPAGTDEAADDEEVEPAAVQPVLTEL